MADEQGNAGVFDGGAVGGVTELGGDAGAADAGAKTSTGASVTSIEAVVNAAAATVVPPKKSEPAPGEQGYNRRAEKRAVEERVKPAASEHGGAGAGDIQAQLDAIRMENQVQLAIRDVALDNGYSREDFALFDNCRTVEDVHARAAALAERDQRVTQRIVSETVKQLTKAGQVSQLPGADVAVNGSTGEAGEFLPKPNAPRTGTQFAKPTNFKEAAALVAKGINIA